MVKCLFPDLSGADISPGISIQPSLNLPCHRIFLHELFPVFNDLLLHFFWKFQKAAFVLAGIEDEPTFTRSVIVNQQETIQVLTQAAQYLSEGYITEKILTVLGDGDRIDEILNDMDEESADRYRQAEQEEVNDDNIPDEADQETEEEQ